MVVLILWPCWKMGLVWAWFKANQTFIAKELCINKNRPELHCDGKCFLMTKMRDVHQQGHNNFVNGLEDLLGKSLVYVFQCLTFRMPHQEPVALHQVQDRYMLPLSHQHILALIKPPAFSTI